MGAVADRQMVCRRWSGAEDDYSRFLTGWALCDGEQAQPVIEAVDEAISPLRRRFLLVGWTRRHAAMSSPTM